MEKPQVSETEKHPEDLAIADGVPFAAHMIGGSIELLRRHILRCPKALDLAGVVQDLEVARAALATPTPPDNGALAKRLLSNILAVVNRHQGANAEQAMAEIHGVCAAFLDAPYDERKPQVMDREELRRALAVAGFVDPDDGTVAMWPHGDRFPRGPVWVSAWRLVDTILANLPQDPDL